MFARKNKSRFILFTCASFVAFSAGSGCSSSGTSVRQDGTSDPSAAAANQPEGWSRKMQELSKTLSHLLPLVTSRNRFNDEKNQEQIVESTQRLQGLAHSLQSSATPNEDPSMRIMSGLFEQDIERALSSLKNGNRDYARSILRDTTSYCIQCHTQSSSGPDFPRLSLDINTEELSPLNRAEFFAATRQFDPALKSYSAALKDENLAQALPFEWEQAARSALAIIVRVKQDPVAAKDLLSVISSNKGLPKSLQGSLASWKKSVHDWEKEIKTQSATKESALTPQQKLAKAEKLIQTAQRRQEYPLDHTQDIVYFRASSLLHDILESQGKKSEVGPKSLYLAGIASEATRDMNFWTLHETFYEMCIRSKPHSELAEKCYTKLNESVTLGYSGSGGTRIPPDLRKRLVELRDQAKTKSASDKRPEKN